MTKTLVSVIVVAGAAGAYAQGQIIWSDDQPDYTIEILSPNPSTPTIEQTGQTTYDVPSGTTTYGGGYIGGVATGGPSGNGPGIGGTPTSGTLGYNYENAGNFEVGLYLATSQSALTSDILTGSPLATSTILGGRNAGVYNVAIPIYTSAMPFFTPVWVGIAAWYIGNGAGSYAASAAGVSAQGYVESTTTVDLYGAPGQPAGLAGLGLTSLSLATTPEPNTIALCVMGASAFLLRLRRKP